MCIEMIRTGTYLIFQVVYNSWIYFFNIGKGNKNECNCEHRGGRAVTVLAQQDSSEIRNLLLLHEAIEKRLVIMAPLSTSIWLINIIACICGQVIDNFPLLLSNSFQSDQININNLYLNPYLNKNTKVFENNFIDVLYGSWGANSDHDND